MTGGALSGRNNRRAVAYGHKSSPRGISSCCGIQLVIKVVSEQYKGRYTKKALLHGDIHPLLVRYLTETDPVVAREQRVCAANLARVSGRFEENADLLNTSGRCL